MNAKPDQIRVLVADDHAVVREGIAAMIADEPDMSVVGEAADGAQAVQTYSSLRPHVMLIDLQMPVMGGIEAILEIKKTWHDARVIALTTYRGDVQAVRTLKAGAVGYLLKSSLRMELLDAIRAVHAGKRYIQAEVAHDIAVHAADDPLSQRELEILTLVAAGKANKLIAHDLGMTEDTVKSHLRNVFAKLDVADRTQAVTVALRRGIIAL